MAEEVIEISIAETQALRAKLGLPPLRGVPSSSSSNTGGADNDAPKSNNDNEISLSINETNALRLKIGLPPLKTSADETKKQGSSASTAIHAPPTNTFAENETKKRIEEMAAKREAAELVRKLQTENERAGGGGGESAADFAAKMLRGKSSSSDKNSNETEGAKSEEKQQLKKKKKRKKKLLMGNNNPQLSLPNDEDEEEDETNTNAYYTPSDLQGIKVSHATSDFTAGSTTILTLADKSILQVDLDSKKVKGFANYEDGQEEENELVNVNMDSDTKALDNLKRKRRIELGAGRAGGYAGYDDDEFEELGGVVGSIGRNNGPLASGGGGRRGESSGQGKQTGGRGFAIGSDGTIQQTTNEDSKTKSDIFGRGGGAISLQSRHVNKVASDFLSHDAADDEGGESKEERLEKERKKQIKLLEKMRRKDKKKKKKDNKKSKRSALSDEEEDEENGGGNSLLQSLEATAVAREVGGKKRRRRDDDNGVDAMEVEGGKKDEQEGGIDDEVARRKRFDQIMEKGKVRTDRAFNKPVSKLSSTSNAAEEDEGDDDDAFLNAALAKARRLKRLKQLHGASGTTGGEPKPPVKAEDAVMQAVAKIKQEEAAAKAGDGTQMDTNNGGGITFQNDEMQEFTRALRARESQVKRSAGGPDRSRKGVAITTKKEVKSETVIKEEVTTAMDDGNVQVEDVDMQELAQEIKDEPTNTDDEGMAFGSTAESAPIGRGMSSFLSLLKQTGEISKHSGKEEMRGRAKDKRTYEDYDNLDLKKVVTAGSGKDPQYMHEKDREFANREIKLEYRDDFGRLLTRKEAYRNMCYQFHGHGSSKKNEERRLKQIEREREEAKVASGRGGRGTLGALKATQEATGKAFVIHKT